ncbi:MAG: electron transfer flavoprotein subunit beta/FixA family protein [Gammaproteobacteria bacterium]|nr:electron transfer flavoprotein subunit beta/FixA family protein [Gammaproteobacteria bacterium]|tara:strand:- start:1466 stop:2227 length:762 start_codon:yes stop_codon:yes gene_type:complete
MKIIVPIKRVLDPFTQARIDKQTQSVDLTNSKMAMNPFCEIAVEEALRLKESEKATETVAVSIGTDKTVDTLRTALAMGIDRAIFIRTETELDLQPLTIGKILASIVKKEEAQLVIMGKQAVDNDNNQTGQMLSGLLNYSLGTFISQFNLSDDNNSIEVYREIDSGIETRSIKLPAIVTVDLRLNEPRYASLPNIMKARSKPLETIEISSLDVDTSARINVLSVEESGSKDRSAKNVNSASELFDELKKLGVM